jgi:hypothetical protein
MHQRCACGHTTRAQACRADDDLLWPGVDIGEQRLLGARLAATVVYLCLRMRLPRRKVSELLLELFALELSAALIDQAVHQAGRCVAPLEDQLALQLEQAVVLHIDETTWPEKTLLLWLWVFCCSHTVLYVIGQRAKEMFENALSADFAGTLMSDGYGVYRARALREVAREFLNDWDVIMRPLADPRLPLTNNAAERQLRHYVIARRISYGTRTPVGSHSVALLASIIDTCRLRGASATTLLARAIHAARTGLPAPSLPPIPTHLGSSASQMAA